MKQLRWQLEPARRDPGQHLVPSVVATLLMVAAAAPVGAQQALGRTELCQGQVEREPPATQGAPQPAASQPVHRNAAGRLHWPRPRSEERQADRKRMVDEQIASVGLFQHPIRSSETIAAMRAVPRHKFVPAARANAAYHDTPLPIGRGQTISQPYIVALMTDLLRIKPGDKVLEIGTGSGYQAAVLTELTPHVLTIEIIEPLSKQAVARFEQLGYRTIEAKQADGYDGWPEHAPFDAIIVTCAAGHVPPPLWDQLKPGGRMVIPIGGTYETQRLILLTKQPNGSRASEDVLPVSFVPMTGKSQRR